MFKNFIFYLFFLSKIKILDTDDFETFSEENLNSL